MSEPTAMNDRWGHDTKPDSKSTVASVWLAVFMFAAFVAALLMVALMFIGFVEIGRGVATFAGFPPSSHVEHGAMESILRGLEFLFLAPVAYMVVRSLVPYVERIRTGKDDAEAKARVVEVKAFVVTLMIAVVATDLIAKISGSAGLKYEAAITECLVIAVLAAYFVCLERLAK